MNRSQLEHIIRASGSIANDDEIIVLGSSSVFAQFSRIQDLRVDDASKERIRQHIIGEGESISRSSMTLHGTARCIMRLVIAAAIGIACHDGHPQSEEHRRSSPSPGK
jgi:hypothetical protein